MAFLDDLGDLVKPITDKSREVATKAKELTETLQLKSQINAEKTAMEEAFQNIGRNYYERHPQCGDEIYEAAYEVIEHCKVQIEEMEEKLHNLTGSRICPHCGARVDKDFTFCGKCGAAMDRAADGADTGDTAEEDGCPEENGDAMRLLEVLDDKTEE